MSALLHPAAVPLELGYLSPHNPYDRRAFSGTSFFAARALAMHPAINLRILGPHRAPGRFDKWLGQTPSKPIQIKDVDTNGLDAVLGLAATPLLEALGQRRPDLALLHVTDATPAFLRDAYGWNIPQQVDYREARLVSRAAATIYSSTEMAARAPKDLALPVITPLAHPFGVNFEALPTDCPRKSSLKKLKLLFVGLDWVRKGGDIVVQTLDMLRQRGVEAELTLVGRPPKSLQGHPGVCIAGFLDKNRPRDAIKLTRLYTKAHLLLLPSRADCTPMVVAEAMAHGTPVIGTETGGLASLLGGAGTGKLLPPSAAPQDWVAAIQQCTTQPEAYAMLSEAAFDRASTALLWSHWADRMHGIALEARLCNPLEVGAA